MSELPNGWTEADIGSVLSARMGKTILSPELVEEGLPVFSASVGAAPWGFIENRDIVFERGTIVVSARGTIGDIKLPDFDEFVSTQTTIAISSTSGIEPAFILNQLKCVDWPMFTATTAIPMLTIGKLNQIRLRIAPLPEQRRIVEKVDGLAARIARARKELDRIPTLVARCRKRLLALAFSGELTVGWRADHGCREPATTTVDDLSEGLRYGTSQKSYPEPNGVAVLRIPNVASGRIDLEDLKYSDLEPKEFAKLRLNEGDILVVRSNGSVDLVGRPALVTGDAVGLAYAGYLIRIRPRHDLVMPKFLTLMLEAPAIRSVVEGGARSTSGVNNVNATELGALTIPLFDIQEQAEIVRRIESSFGWLERMAADHVAATRLLPKLDAAILAKAFQGKLVPQDPNDEPAGVLLERIKAERSAAPKVKRSRQAHKTISSKDLRTMAKNLEQVLAEAGDWISAQDAFQQCGIDSASTTEDIEKIYGELRKLDKAERIEAEPVNDDQGRKLHDRLRLKVA